MSTKKEKCCVSELSCLCPGKDGMSEHDSEKCPCPEHYATHEEWLRYITTAVAKREKELVEEVKKIDMPSAFSDRNLKFNDGVKSTIEKVLSLLKHL